MTSRAAARWAYGQGLRTASVLRSEQPWENSQGEFFAQEFSSIGGQVLSTQESPADEREFKVQAVRIKKEKADVVFLTTFNQISFAAKALNKFKVSSVKAVALLDDAHLQASDNTLEGAIFYLFRGPNESFQKKYKQRFGELSGYASDYSYDAVQAIAAAIRKAGSDNPQAVKNALNSIEFPASIGANLKIGEDRFVSREIQLYKVIGNKIAVVKD